MKVRPLTFLA